MRLIKYLIVAAVLLIAGTAQAQQNWLYTGTASGGYGSMTGVQFPKADAIPLPPSANGANFIVAFDWNTAAQALKDINTVWNGAQWLGWSEQAADPAPTGKGGVGQPSYTWPKTDHTLHYHVNNVDYVVAGVGIIQSAGVSATLGGTTQNTFTAADGSTAAVSAAGQGAIRYNNGATRWEQSVNGGSWSALGGGGGTIGGSIANTQIAFGTAANTIGGTANLIWDNTNNFVTQIRTAVATAQSPGVSLQNTTAAANGAQQFSPMIELVGAGWGTTGAASQAVKGAWQLRPVQGTNATVDLVAWVQGGGGSYTEIARFTNFTPLFNIQGLQFANNANVEIGLQGTNSSNSLMRLTANNGGAGRAQFTLDGNSSVIQIVLAGSSNYYQFSTTEFKPQTDNLVALGATAQRFLGLYNSGPLSGKYNTQSGTTYTILASDYYVGLSNASARTVTLCAANAFIAGQNLIMKDEGGTTSGITANRAGSDTIIDTATGGTSVATATAGGFIILVSDGVSKWFVVGKR